MTRRPAGEVAACLEARAKAIREREQERWKGTTALAAGGLAEKAERARRAIHALYVYTGGDGGEDQHELRGVLDRVTAIRDRALENKS